MSLPIRPIFTPGPQNETPVPMEQLWNSRTVYFACFGIGLAVGFIATYFIAKMWSHRRADPTDEKKPPLSGRATTQPASSRSIPSDAPKTEIPQKPQSPPTPSPRLTATPTATVYLPPKELPIDQVAQEFRANFAKAFGICRMNGVSLNLVEMIDLILRNSSQSEYFNLPDFFKSDKPFIDLYLASINRNSQSDEKALRVANDHLKWLLTKDAFFTLQRIGKENKIPTPKFPLLLEFSSLEEMEKAAGQIDQWKLTNAEKLNRIKKLNLTNLGLVSVPGFIGQLSSLETLDLRVNQLFAIPLSLALLPLSCTITIDKPLDLSSFNEEVRKIRLTHPNLGPKIIMPT